MPKSRSRAKAVAKRKRATQVREFEGFSAMPVGLFGDRGSEEVSVMMLAQADPDGPHCAGPVLIHQDGNFECHGDCHGDEGRSALKTYHPVDEAVWPCSSPDRPQVPEIRIPCARCGGLTN